jgi:beta-glucosidase
VLPLGALLGDISAVRREDVSRLAAAGCRHCRLNLEWARLEPSPGVFDATETLRCRDVISCVKAEGIEPLLTLCRFPAPDWFDAAGGFVRPGNIPVFLAYAEYVMKHLGQFADEYITFDTPERFFPTDITSILSSCRIQSVLASCHMETYALIHETRGAAGFSGTKAGCAHQVKTLDGKLTAYFFHNAFVRACFSGWFDFPLKNYSELGTGVFVDFIGINFHNRDDVAGYAANLWKMLPLPVFAAESETCGGGHMEALEASGLPVERYYRREI